MSGSIHLSDNGTIHRITIKDQDGALVDMSGVSLMTITYRRPDGTTTIKTPMLVNDGKDGLIKVTLTSSDLNQSGTYRWQGDFTFVLGTWHTQVQSFKVEPNV